MQCDQFEQQLHARLDQRISPEWDADLVRHADSCRRCRGQLDAYATLWAGLDSTSLDVPATDFAQRVVTRAQPRTARLRQWRTYLGFALAAGLLVAVIPGLLHFLSSSPPEATLVGAGQGGDAESRVNQTPRVDEPAIAQRGTEATRIPPLHFQTLWNQLSLQISTERPTDIEPLSASLRPITTPLSTALDALRNTIPLGRSERPLDKANESADVIRHITGRTLTA